MFYNNNNLRHALAPSGIPQWLYDRWSSEALSTDGKNWRTIEQQEAYMAQKISEYVMLKGR